MQALIALFQNKDHLLAIAGAISALVLGLNALLSAIGYLLKVFANKDVPFISKACAVLKKVSDFLSANLPH